MIPLIVYLNCNNYDCIIILNFYIDKQFTITNIPDSNDDPIVLGRVGQNHTCKQLTYLERLQVQDIDCCRPDPIFKFRQKIVVYEIHSQGDDTVDYTQGSVVHSVLISSHHERNTPSESGGKIHTTYNSHLSIETQNRVTKALNSTFTGETLPGGGTP